jgi:hypothetical protein
MFGRSKGTIADLAIFQQTPITHPLLTSTEKTAAKGAVEAFKIILAYTQPRKANSGSIQTALSLLKILITDLTLRDEIYFQLMKQTNRNTDKDSLLLTWQLLLMVATLVPSTKPFEMWIKAHLLRNSQEKNRQLSRTIQLTDFRFAARSAIGAPERVITAELLEGILADVVDGHRCFKVSVYEQMWHQRKAKRGLRIPWVVHRMAMLLLEKGAEQWEGIFRLPGSGAKVNELTDALNRGEDKLDAVGMNDLASLFKSWFAGLPIPLVPASEVSRLRGIAEKDRNFVDFVSTLPPLHARVLTYLIGFLQKMAPAANVTRMTAKNLAICFSPNIISSEGVGAADFARHTEMSSDFVVELIEKLDTSTVYPDPSA